MEAKSNRYRFEWTAPQVLSQDCLIYDLNSLNSKAAILFGQANYAYWNVKITADRLDIWTIFIAR